MKTPSKSMRNLLSITIALSGIALPHSQASITVETQAAAPTENVFLNIAPEGTLNQRWQYISDTIASGHTEPGQTFRAPVQSDTTLSQIAFKISDVNGGIGSGVYNADFTLTIYRFASATATTPGEIALQDEGTLPASLLANDYLVFSLETPLTLAAGEYYGIVLSFPEAAANQGLSFVNALNSSYGDGQGIFYSNKPNADTMTWKVSGGDFHMVLVSIPEPGSTAMIGAVGIPLLLLWKRARRIRREA